LHWLQVAEKSILFCFVLGFGVFFLFAAAKDKSL
jgi:hypothetical protein